MTKFSKHANENDVMPPCVQASTPITKKTAVVLKILSPIILYLPSGFVSKSLILF